MGEDNNMSIKLPRSLTDALRTHDGSKTIAKRLFEETEQLKKSLKNTQDELENWRGKYHQADKEMGIMGTKISRGTLSDVMKYIFSVVPAGIGINLITGK